ncbi:MAG: tetratricopeptide repeat protein [Cellulophaga sp.]|uniref:tetratricopeptide repeat protein n=1 Tax=Cellulophaga sp. TaxID=1972202 RepID=UPI0032644CB4
MKKFFKILAIIFGVILLSFFAYLGYIYYTYQKVNKSIQQKNEKVINFESNLSEDYFDYSVSINKSGDFNKGFKYLDKAVELEPVKHLGYRGWIRLRKIRDYDKALMDFDRLDSLTPNVIDAPWGEDIDFLRGECHYGNKNYQNAIKAFNQSIVNQDEDWADIHSFVYLGLCEYELGNYEKSIIEFQRALKQYESVPESFFGMARAYQKLGEIEKAKENIMKAEKNIVSKRDDYYNEYLNEIYISEVLEFKQTLEK